MAGTAERHGSSAALIRFVSVGRRSGSARIQPCTVKQLQLKHTSMLFTRLEHRP